MRASGFDLVIGNPPFLNRMERATAGREGAALLRARFPGAMGPYADAASAFLALAHELAADGGRVSLVQPQSVLSARDALPLRRMLARSCTLEHIWSAPERVFDAGVYACVLTLRKGGGQRGAGVAMLRRACGEAFAPLPPIALDMNALEREPTWAHLASEAAGVPSFAFESAGTLSDIAHATADFRDQYYGLSGLVEEGSAASPPGAARPRLITTGLIELASCAWGVRPARLHRERWLAPCANLSGLADDDPMARWARARLVPKVLLATQTRVLEAWVDEAGVALPVVPTITVTPRMPEDLWRAASALASPVSTVVAARGYAGAGLSPGAIKLSARQCLTMPLPRDAGAWEEGAALFRAAQGASDAEAREGLLRRYGRATALAYRAEPLEPLLEWWNERRGAAR